MWPFSTVTEPKRFRYAKRLRAIVGAPAPFGIDRPQRNVREDDDGRAAGEPFHIIFEPLELLGAELAQAAGLQVHHVDQADEVHAFVIEAVPAVALRALAVALADIACRHPRVRRARRARKKHLWCDADCRIWSTVSNSPVSRDG